jgi:hypothetical protein
MGDHEVWHSLDKLLTSMKGEDLAMKYVNGNDLTPLEFLSACSAQAPFINSWAKRVELMRAARIAISQDIRRVHAFAESLFRLLIQSGPVDDEGLCSLVSVYLDTQRMLEPRYGTECILKCLYDPIFSRIENNAKAQELGRQALKIIDQEFQLLSIQKILLYTSFKQRDEEEDNDESSESSLSEWDNTSDSTESSFDIDEIEILPEQSAAAAWMLSPTFLDPPILTSFGKYLWCGHHIRYLLNQYSTNPNIARRGFELFASIGQLTIPSKKQIDEQIEDVCLLLKDGFTFVVHERSLVARDVLGEFLISLSPLSFSWNVLAKLARDLSLPSTVRGYILDIIRRINLKTDRNIMYSVSFALQLLEGSDQDDDNIVTSCFSIIESLIARSRTGNVKCEDAIKKHADRIKTVVTDIHRKAKEMESELLESDRYQLRLEHPVKNHISEPGKTPENYNSESADRGRARLIAGTAEILLNSLKALSD